MSRFVVSGVWFSSLLLIGCTSHHERDAPRAAVAAPDPARELDPSLISPSLPTEPEVPEAWTDLGRTTSLKYKPLTGAIGDVTGDGQADVVVIAYLVGNATGLVVLTGAGDGSFSEGTPLELEGEFGGSGVGLADFDSDGDLDALILDAGGKPAYRVANNLGSGRFELGSAHVIPGRDGGELRHAAIADLDADGDLDAVVPLWDSLRILEGDGNRNFTAGRRLSSARDPFDVALADLDADGDLDLVTATGAGFPVSADNYDTAGASLWLYRGDGGGFAKPEGISVAAISRVEIADLDGDGELEVVATGSAGITIVEDPLGVRETQLLSVASDGPLLIADLTGTLAPDLATCSYIQGQVHILSGYPNSSKSSLGAGDYVTAMFAADVARNEGRHDLVLLNAGPPPQPYAAGSPSIEVRFTDDL
ncbi:FG-GAP repeat domain-containing protein [Enhygromyxa salina]|uniref:FG-GAP repeat protein n=1 Tax=Enhygromyxa salina TaxID=215803 RepID=A0A2S9YUL1_9BACT|nr:VCBS repeat-containing protein [Enhygromyxa salina]PRQ08722.1 FG-GAP repeat protein [Enhygromyxa salina]